MMTFFNNVGFPDTPGKKINSQLATPIPIGLTLDHSRRRVKQKPLDVVDWRAKTSTNAGMFSNSANARMLPKWKGGAFQEPELGGRYTRQSQFRRAPHGGIDPNGECREIGHSFLRARICCMIAHDLFPRRSPWR